MVRIECRYGLAPHWFQMQALTAYVCEIGILSYYRHPDDEGKASKGSISMSVAEIHTRGNDLKFEISSNLGKAFGSFWLKGNRESFFLLQSKGTTLILIPSFRSRGSCSMDRSVEAEH